MDKFLGYRCSLCGTEYAPNEVAYTCPKDGGNLDILLDYRSLKKKFHAEDITSRGDFSKRPLPTPCPSCGGTLVIANKNFAQCMDCETQFPLDDVQKEDEPAGEAA